MRTRFRKREYTTIPAHYGYYASWLDRGNFSTEYYPDIRLPVGTVEYIADESPHSRSIAFPAMEHYRVDDITWSHGATTCMGVNSSSGLSPCSQDMDSKCYCWNYQHLHISNVVDDIADYKYDPALPWHMRYYSAAEPTSWAATFKERIARWGIGRNGLAESLGEVDELPKLWNFVAKGRGYYRNAANAYLAYAFGWRPLLDLIPGVMEEISQTARRLRPKSLKEPGDRYLCFRMPVREPFRGEQTIYESDPCPSSWPQLSRYSVSQWKWSRCEAIGMFRATVKRKPLTGYEVVQRLADLDGIPNWRTVWELVPMSFVVDYFASIGGLISRIQGNPLYDIDVDQAALGLRIEGSGPCYTHMGVGNITTTNSAKLRYYWRGPMPTGFLALSFPGAQTVPTGICLAMQRCPRIPAKMTRQARRALYKALRSRFGQYCSSLGQWATTIM